MADSITVHHATPRRNLASIFCTGLQPGLARGKLKVVWLHASGKSRWAVQHVARRHHVPAGRVAVLTVRLSRSMLRRNRRGVWCCPFLIVPGRIVGINGLKLFAA
jgi:hypothetical protein